MYSGVNKHYFKSPILDVHQMNKHYFKSPILDIYQGEQTLF